MATVNFTIDNHIDLLMKGIEYEYEQALFERIKARIDENYAEAIKDAKSLAKTAAIGAVDRIVVMNNMNKPFGGYDVCVAFNGEQFNG